MKKDEYEDDPNWYTSSLLYYHMLPGIQTNGTKARIVPFVNSIIEKRWFYTRRLMYHKANQYAIKKNIYCIDHNKNKYLCICHCKKCEDFMLKSKIVESLI